MKTLTSAQKKYLRTLSHGLRPLVHIGRKGITPELTEEINLCLESHELVKVKFLELKEKRKEVAEEIAQQLKACQVSLTGNVLTLFREQEDPEKRKTELPPSKKRRRSA